MINLSTLALIAAQAMGISHPSFEQCRILDAAVTACSSAADPETCTLDATIYGVHESWLSMNPHPFAWDSKAGLAKGVWQEWNAPIGAAAQAKRWVSLRADSLKRYGDLRGLAGATPSGARLARSREMERSDVLFSISWAE